MNVVYASDLTVMLFAVWSQGASGKKKMRSLKHTSKYFIDFVLQCHFTDTSDFYSTSTSDAKLYLTSKVLQVFWGKNSMVEYTSVFEFRRE